MDSSKHLDPTQLGYALLTVSWMKKELFGHCWASSKGIKVASAYNPLQRNHALSSCGRVHSALENPRSTALIMKRNAS